MALAETTVWEVQTGGNDINGGGYSEAGGVDYSTQNDPQVNVSDAVCTGTTNLQSTNATFTSAMVGNLLYLSSGPAWYIIDAFVDVSNVTLDRAGPSASGMTCRVGGALATPGGLGAVLAAHGVAGMKAYISTGEYPLSVVGANVSSGSLDLTAAMPGKDCYIQGYDTTRDNLGTPPKYLCSAIPTIGTAIRLQGTDGEPHTLVNVHVDGDSVGTKGIRGTSFFNSQVLGCLVENCTDGFYTVHARRCKAMNNSSRGFYYSQPSLCWSHNNTSIGFQITYGADQCIASSNNSYGFYQTYQGANACTAYGNGIDGFRSYSIDTMYTNCISANNDAGDWEYNLLPSCKLFNCASWVNASDGRSTGGVADINPIILTADPFIDAANGDFRLNNLPGGGLLCRAAGLGVYGQTGSPNVGAVLLDEKKRRLQMRVIA